MGESKKQNSTPAGLMSGTSQEPMCSLGTQEGGGRTHWTETNSVEMSPPRAPCSLKDGGDAEWGEASKSSPGVLRSGLLGSQSLRRVLPSVSLIFSLLSFHLCPSSKGTSPNTPAALSPRGLRGPQGNERAASFAPKQGARYQEAAGAVSSHCPG